VADRLAEHPDTAWVQLTSGGTEIFSTIRSRNRDVRTPLLLSQLSVGRQVVGLEAYCLLHIFATGASAPESDDLSLTEIQELVAPARRRVAVEGSAAALQDADWPLVEALAEDGRSTYRQLAEHIHWHESTVRRRVEELVTAGVLSFDVDLDTEAFGLRSPALLWMSVVPARLAAVGQALTGHSQVKFVAATTGSTNLVAAVVCEDDRSLYDFITGEIAALDGLTHVETSPVMRAVKMHATIARLRS
jgi:DNA-binding Lrp family transcriptional regulator